MTSSGSIDALAIKNLADITDKDFAKAWSFFDYVAMKLERAGQIWLRQTCFAAGYKDKSDFMRRWRKFSEEIFPVDEGVDVFAVIDKKWRQYAESDQMREGR